MLFNCNDNINIMPFAFCKKKKRNPVYYYNITDSSNEYLTQINTLNYRNRFDVYIIQVTGCVYVQDSE